MLEGLPPNNAAHVMRLRCDERSARRVVDVIVETFDPAETAAAAFEEEVHPTSWQNAPPWFVEVFFGREPDEAAIRALVAAGIGHDLAAEAVFEKVAARDWVAASLAGLEPVRVGRFVVHGSHGRTQVKTGDIGIEIEAALAFGTGHHGTTRGCLCALNEIGRRRRPVRILDVGTGTGVLAIAAARRFNRHVRCGDIDAIAVAAARDNARTNAARTNVRPVVSRGVQHPVLRGGAPYDLVCANILARQLRQLAPSLRRVAAPNAELVLSGLLDGDVAGVVSTYRAHGFVLRSRRNLEGWATLLMQRQDAF